MQRVMCFIVTALLILLQITCQNQVEKQFRCADEACSGNYELSVFSVFKFMPLEVFQL